MGHQVGVGEEPQLAHLPRRGGDSLLVTGDRVFGLKQRRLRADPHVLDLVVVGAEVDRALVLLDGPPDGNPPVTGEQVAVLAQQRGVPPLQALLAVLLTMDLGLKQRLGRQEVIARPGAFLLTPLTRPASVGRFTQAVVKQPCRAPAEDRTGLDDLP
jgi:hypothetical protein